MGTTGGGHTLPSQHDSQGAREAKQMGHGWYIDHFSGLEAIDEEKGVLTLVVVRHPSGAAIEVNELDADDLVRFLNGG